MDFRHMTSALIIFAFATSTGCSAANDDEKDVPGIEFKSEAFEHEKPIPVKYTCEGEDISPDLSWGKPPEGTLEMALICDDPDAPVGTWVHWVVYGIPADSGS